MIESHDLFRFERTGRGDDQLTRGHFKATGILPRCLDALRAAGCDLPAEFFQERNLEFSRLDNLTPIS